MTLVTKKFDIDNAELKDFEAIQTYSAILSKERLPDDPIKSTELIVKEMKSLKRIESMEFTFRYTWHEEKIVGFLFTAVAFEESNQHLMEIGLTVLHEYRRKGIATHLLKYALEKAKEHNRSLLIDSSSERVPSGEAFAKRLNAKAGISEHTNQLVLADLDLKLIHDWVEQAKTKAAAFSLEFLDGAIPEEQMDEVLDLMHVMNTAPKDDLDIEDFHATAKQMRDVEALWAERGMERWMYFARHKETNELAGYTELFTNPANLELLSQGATGVLPKYRGHALGRWLKASMVLKVLKEKPDIKFIRTGNADSNAAMLAINNAMGFKPFNAETIWQLETNKLEAYLTEKGLI